MKGNKRNKNKNRKQNNKAVKLLERTRLYKTINPISQRTDVLLSTSEFLTTLNGSPEIAFSSGNLYWDISSVTSLSDFTEQSDSYLFCRFTKVVLDIVRTTDELTMVNNLRGGDIYLGYYPHVSSTNFNYNSLSRDSNSYRIDPMTFDEQKVVVILPDYTGYNPSGGVDYWVNISKYTFINNLPFARGEIAIRTSNTINNVAVTILFKIKIKIHAEFYHRL